MIEFKNVTKKYASEPVLEKVSFLIDKGSFAFLVGPTGSGKTTVFRLIIRDIVPTEGAITLGDWDLLSLPRSKVPHLRRRVGVVFQDLKLLVDRTVAENVMLPLEFSGASENEARKRAETILSEVGLGGKFDKFPLQLSGGEGQRVAIARALVFEPEIILADEPTGNLDTQTSFQILDLLQTINKKGTTVFMATHNDKLIGDHDRVIILEEGRIVEDRSKQPKKKASQKQAPEEKDGAEEKEKRGKIKLEALAKNPPSHKASADKEND